MNRLVIQKEDLRHNIEQIKEYAAKSGQDDNGNPLKIIAVVKANGYGLGIVEYTKFLIDNGIDFFAVSTVQEAILLRQKGIKEKILMLSSTAIKEDVEKLVENNIIITIGSQNDVKIAEEVASKKNIKIKAHLKIDTGFGRYGFIYSNREEMIQVLKEMKNIEIEGTYSHFSVSFFDEKYTKLQFERFLEVIEILKMNDIPTGMLHICNSSAFVKYPIMHLNAVRIGFAFVGRLSFQNYLGLKKIGYMESQVTEIKMLPKGFNIGYSNTFKTKKETKIAVIPCGSMDGINLTIDRDTFRIVDKLRYVVRDVKDFFKKQNIYVKINNQNCKVLGRVGTYHVICDITDKEIQVGDKAVFNINPMFVDSSVKREYR